MPQVGWPLALGDSVALEGNFDRFLADDGIILPFGEENEFYARYPELTVVIPVLNDAIHRLGGQVLVRLRGKTPKDAIWINPTNSLCCCGVDEVLMMIKASDRISNSINPAGMVLYRWLPAFNAGFEFRIFFEVASGILGISQKNCTSLYRHLLGEEHAKDREALRQALISQLQHQAVTLTVDSVVDVRVDWQLSKGVLIVDVEPEQYCTDYCLFGGPQELRQAVPRGSLLLVEREEDCRLGIFNQNLMPLDLLQQLE
jgi:hypothetical protein